MEGKDFLEVANKLFKLNIEEIFPENEDSKSNNNAPARALHADRKVQEEECQDEVMKLRIALEEKDRQYLSLLADFDNLKRRVDRDSRL